MYTVNIRNGKLVREAIEKYTYHKTKNALDIPKLVSNAMVITSLLIVVAVGTARIQQNYMVRNQEYVKMTPQLKKKIVDDWYEVIIIEEESRQ